MYAMISRSIREGLRGVGRHFAMAVSSAIAVSIALLIISVFMIFSIHLQRFTLNFEEGIKISATVDYHYESGAEEARIMNDIKKIEGVSDVDYYTKEEEYQYYLDIKDSRVRDVFAAWGDENPMHDAFYVTAESGYDLSVIAGEIDRIEGIDHVDYGGQSTLNIVAFLETVRRFGAMLVFGLTILAIFLIQNTIKLTIHARQDEIDIMRNVGATNMFIRAPFLWEGAFIGAMGAILPSIATMMAYGMVYDKTGGYLISSMFRLLEPSPFIHYLSLFLFAAGILVGLLGSLLSVNRYLRWRR